MTTLPVDKTPLTDPNRIVHAEKMVRAGPVAEPEGNIVFNLKEILARVDKVLADGGDDPYLVGYDVNEIQAFVTASSRPIVMRGASNTIAELDAEQESSSIFAGGGQGMLVARGKQAAEDKCVELQRVFHKRTRGDVLVTATVKLDRSNAQRSRRWLRQRLDIEKDAAPKPEAALPAGKAEQCPSCGARKATTTRQRYGREERICDRCAKLSQVGGNEQETAQSLNELSPLGRIVAVSADGNNFGAMFDELDTLHALGVVSSAVRLIFHEARKHAKNTLPPRQLSDGRLIPRMVGVAVGGDDIRAFVAEEYALPYVLALVAGLRRHAALISRELRGVQTLSAKTCDRIENLGVGIGLVSSDSHFPAYRLMEYAHELELSAKRLCSENSHRKSAPARFALDFAILRSGYELIQGSVKRTDQSSDIRPIDLSCEGDLPVWKQVKALKRVPTAQQATFAEAARTEGRSAKNASEISETANLLRYQVARSDEWQAYYDACEVNWKKPEEVERFRPTQGLFDLARLLGDNHGGL